MLSPRRRPKAPNTALAWARAVADEVRRRGGPCRLPEMCQPGAMGGGDDAVIALWSDNAERLALETLALDELEEGDGPELRGLLPPGCVSLSARRPALSSLRIGPPTGDSA